MRYHIIVVNERSFIFLRDHYIFASDTIPVGKEQKRILSTNLVSGNARSWHKPKVAVSLFFASEPHTPNKKP